MFGSALSVTGSDVIGPEVHRWTATCGSSKGRPHTGRHRRDTPHWVGKSFTLPRPISKYSVVSYREKSSVAWCDVQTFYLRYYRILNIFFAFSSQGTVVTNVT